MSDRWGMSIHEDEMQFYAGMEERRIEDEQLEERIAARHRAEGTDPGPDPDSWGLDGWLFS